MSASLHSKLASGSGTTDGTANMGGAATSMAATGTLTASSDTLFVGCLTLYGTAGAPGSRVQQWNGAATTLGPTVTLQQPAGVWLTAQIDYTISPANGANSHTASWTNASDYYISGSLWQGTDTTTGIEATDSQTSNSALTLNMTSTPDGATVAIANGVAGVPTMTKTYLWGEANIAAGAGGDYALGGTTNTHTFGSVGADHVVAGIHILGSGGTAARKLVRTFLG